MDTNHCDLVDIKTPLPASFRELHSLWDTWRDGAAMPHIKQFYIDQVPTSLLPWSVMAEIVDNDGARDYLFRFWGTERVTLIGAEMTGRLLSEIEDKSMREGNLAEYEDVCARGTPLLCTTPVTVSLGRPMSIVSLRLPIADAAGNIARIFSTTDPSTISAMHYDHFGTHPSYL